MEVKTFRAASLADALQLVRRELGPEAAVLHTRELPRRRRLWPFAAARQEFEVTASLEVAVPSRIAPREPEPRPIEPPRVKLSEALQAGGGSSRATRDDVSGQLSQLQSMVEELCRRGHDTRRPELPEHLFRLYADLIEHDLDEPLVRELVERVRQASIGAELHDLLMAKTHLARMIEDEIRVQGPLRCEPGNRRLVALVGPTGVGKTTTIAKLAAHYRLREKRRVGLITVDTYRVAAVEQLRTYADIMDLPMEVVSTPREMRQAIARLESMDLVLLDTAGRSPKDEVRIQELRAFVGEARADEVHLVLSCVTGAAALQRTAEQFAAVGTTALIVTKLDEAPGLGPLLPLCRSSHLPLSYVTTGQNVPDDIEPADARRLARSLLGLEHDARVAA